MSRIDDLEALSRMQAGEEEASLVRDPELVRALERLDAATSELQTDLPEPHLDRLVRAALPARRPRSRVALVAAAALAVLAAAAALWPRPAPVPVLRLPAASILLASGTEIVSGDVPALVRGSALVEGRATLALQGTRVSVEGRTLVSREPPEVLARVTSLPGGDMIDWKKLAVPTAAAGMLAIGVAVFEGRATVSTPDGPARELKAGDRYTSEPEGTRGPPGATAPALPGPATDPQGAGELGKMREEKEQLLRERARLRAALAAAQKTAAGALRTAPMNASHYRFSQEELVEMAEQGMVLFRLPHLDAGELPYDEKARADVGLTPDEEAGIRRIYGESFERMRSGLTDIYQAQGGDPKAAAGATPGKLWRDILDLSSPQDRADATREAAKERAGLAPVTPGGSVALRVARLLQGEDERVINELDTLLGPQRAQSLLDDPGTQHSDFVSQHTPHPDGG